jgi:hypothetical protein
MPAFPDLLAMSAAIFGVATWVIPPVRYLLSFRKGPRDSLSVVGRVIGLFVLAAMLSVAGLVLALLTLVYTDRTFWGWVGLGLSAAFWLALLSSMVISDILRWRRQESERP